MVWFNAQTHRLAPRKRVFISQSFFSEIHFVAKKTELFIFNKIKKDTFYGCDKFNNLSTGLNQSSEVNP
jgi:hypothetical protein